MRSERKRMLCPTLMITHFPWAMWANCSWPLIFVERPERFTHIAHFWWATWAIHSHCSFSVSNLSDSLTSLTKKRGNEQFAHFLNKKNRIYNILKNKILDFLAKIFWANHSFAHFLWATWANRSWSLIFGEQPERFAHIAHFWWATWAIHSHCSPKKGNERFAHF